MSKHLTILALTMAEAESEDIEIEDNCEIIPPETLRLYLVGVCGTILATISLVFNVFLFLLLVRNRHHRRSHLLYLLLLALIDVFLSGKDVYLYALLMNF